MVTFSNCENNAFELTGETDLQQQQQQPQYSAGRGQWNNEGVPVQQLRKLELSDDDRALMNKFRAQGKTQ